MLKYSICYGFQHWKIDSYSTGSREMQLLKCRFPDSSSGAWPAVPIQVYQELRYGSLLASDMGMSKITHLSLILWKQTVKWDSISFALYIYIYIYTYIID